VNTIGSGVNQGESCRIVVLTGGFTPLVRMALISVDGLAVAEVVVVSPSFKHGGPFLANVFNFVIKNFGLIDWGEVGP